MQSETEQLKDYLRGMKRGNTNGLAQMNAINDWPGTAQRELERRAAFILKMFPDEVLLGLASGDIEIRQALVDVVAE
ncbi:hypothetical protein [Lysobacter sp. CA196]|uniref:hypothetical protein n=1 Tax=Lysobacter sp. CA196 TaxID=3455606 RepID=UPI003F8D54D2